MESFLFVVHRFIIFVFSFCRPAIVDVIIYGRGPHLFLFILHGGSFNSLRFVLTLCFDGGETGRVEVQCNGMLLMFVNHCVLRKPTISLQSEPMLPLNLFPEQVEKRKRKEVHDPFEH